jgi:nicotinamidase-related amidase
MLMRAERCGLLVVDVQEKLLPHMHAAPTLLDNCVWLVKIAHRLDVPIAASEQYPQGLGATVAQLRETLGAAPILPKVTFSCAEEPALMQTPALARSQVVVAGIEAHVCVLQSAIELCGLGKDVFVVADAVASRVADDKQVALNRLRDFGIQVVSREMVAFEWLERAGTPVFREISREFLR